MIFCIMNFMNIKKISSMICLSAFVSLTSCDTDIESVGINEPTIEEQNPTMHTAYLQQLLQYKQQSHQVVFGWFDNADKQPASQGQLISAVPDSLDYIVLTHPDSLTANELKSMRSLRQEKGTRTLYEINFKQFVERYDALKQAFSEDPANKGKEFKLQLNTFLVDSIQYRLSLADRYGYDGVVMNFSAQLPLYMTPMEQDFYLALENDVLGMAKDWKERHSDKMLVLSGMPTFIKDKSVLKLASYIIIPAQGTTNAGALRYLINKAMADGVPTNKFVPMVDLYSLDKADVKTGYWGKTFAAIGAARVVAMASGGYQLAGLALGNINNDYYHAAFTYPVVRQAISIINPSVKK